MQQPAPEAPPKRTRRTKAEIAADAAQQPAQVAPQPEFAASAPAPEVYHAHATTEPAELPCGPFKSEIVADDTEAHVWDILSALAMNPSLAALPAVDLADRALAIVVAGQRALGGS